MLFVLRVCVSFGLKDGYECMLKHERVGKRESRCDD